MEINRGYLYSLPNDRLAFGVTAGIPTEATPLGGGKNRQAFCVLHVALLDACALLYGSTGDTEILAKANGW
jgi:hypothetical protein